MSEAAGIWQRAGMSGVLIGLDWPAALARAAAFAPDAGTSEIMPMLEAIETGALSGAGKRAERESDQ